MKVRKHITFRENDNPELIQYLSEQGITYSKGEIISSLECYEHDANWGYISQYVNEKRLLCHSETIFSQLELSNAEWLTVRSKWKNGYPQPEASFAYESITYSSKSFCSQCGAGLTQVNPFRIKSIPKWGNKHFMMLNWIPDELFVDESAKDILQQNDVSGISFWPVHNKTGRETLSRIYQIAITDILHPGIRIDAQSIDTVIECPNCGIPKYHPTGIGMHSFKREIFDGASDVVKSFEVFGWGRSACRLIIINQKTYQLLIQHKLDKNLVFEPVMLV